MSGTSLATGAGPGLLPGTLAGGSAPETPVGAGDKDLAGLGTQPDVFIDEDQGQTHDFAAALTTPAHGSSAAAVLAAGPDTDDTVTAPQARLANAAPDSYPQYKYVVDKLPRDVKRAMRAFPAEAKRLHALKGERNKYLPGEPLKHLGLWMRLSAQNMAEMGAEAIVHSGAVLFTRALESKTSQLALEQMLKNLALGVDFSFNATQEDQIKKALELIPLFHTIEPKKVVGTRLQDKPIEEMVGELAALYGVTVPASGRNTMLDILPQIAAKCGIQSSVSGTTLTWKRDGLDLNLEVKVPGKGFWLPIFSSLSFETADDIKRAAYIVQQSPEAGQEILQWLQDLDAIDIMVAVQALAAEDPIEIVADLPTDLEPVLKKYRQATMDENWEEANVHLHEAYDRLWATGDPDVVLCGIKKIVSPDANVAAPAPVSTKPALDIFTRTEMQGALDAVTQIVEKLDADLMERQRLTVASGKAQYTPMGLQILMNLAVNHFHLGNKQRHQEILDFVDNYIKGNQSLRPYNDPGLVQKLLAYREVCRGGTIPWMKGPSAAGTERIIIVEFSSGATPAVQDYDDLMADAAGLRDAFAARSWFDIAEFARRRADLCFSKDKTPGVSHDETQAKNSLGLYLELISQHLANTRRLFDPKLQFETSDVQKIAVELQGAGKLDGIKTPILPALLGLQNDKEVMGLPKKDRAIILASIQTVGELIGDTITTRRLQASIDRLGLSDEDKADVVARKKALAEMKAPDELVPGAADIEVRQQYAAFLRNAFLSGEAEGITQILPELISMINDSDDSSAQKVQDFYSLLIGMSQIAGMMGRIKAGNLPLDADSPYLKAKTFTGGKRRAGTSSKSKFTFDNLPKRKRDSFPEAVRAFIPNPSKKDLFPRFKKLLDEIAMVAMAPQNVAIRLVGPPGTGKTTMAELFAQRRGLPYYRVGFSRLTDKSDIEGMWNREDVDGQMQTVFEEGPFTLAARSGGVVYLDEIDKARTGTIAALNNEIAPGKTILVRNRQGEIERVFVNKDYHVFVGENGVGAVGSQQHGDDFVRRFVTFYVHDWDKNEVSHVIKKIYQNYAGKPQWDNQFTATLAQFHEDTQKLARGGKDPVTGRSLQRLGDGSHQRINFTPRSILRLARRLALAGAITTESLSRAIRSEYCYPLSDQVDRDAIWSAARRVFGSYLTAKGLDPAVGTAKIPLPTQATIERDYFNGRSIADDDFAWTRQTVLLAEEILANWKIGISPMLIGPAGTGKTEVPTQLAKAMQLAAYLFTMSKETDEQDLIGSPAPRPGGGIVFEPGVITHVYQDGGVAMLDEIFLCDPPKVEGTINAALDQGPDDRGAIYLKTPPQVIKQKINSYMIAMTNPAGGEFGDRNEQSEALMSRFAVIYLTGELGLTEDDVIDIMEVNERKEIAFGTQDHPRENGSGKARMMARLRESLAARKAAEQAAAMTAQAAGPAGAAAKKKVLMGPGDADSGTAQALGVDFSGGTRQALTLANAVAAAPIGPGATPPIDDPQSPYVSLPIHDDWKFISGMPTQLVMDRRNQTVLEVGANGVPQPLSRKTQKAIDQAGRYVKTQTQRDMSLATRRVLDLEILQTGWHQTNLRTGAIHINIIHLLTQPKLFALAVCKHEWGHARFDGLHEFFHSSEVGRLYANHAADPRMDNIWGSLSIDFEAQRQVMRDIMIPEEPTFTPEDQEKFNEMYLPHEQFNSGILYYWWRGKIPDIITRDDVREALESALPYIEQAYTQMPRTMDDADIEQSLENYYKLIEKAWPFYETLLEKGRDEVIEKLLQGMSEDDLKDIQSPLDFILKLIQQIMAQQQAQQGQPGQQGQAGQQGQPGQAGQPGQSASGGQPGQAGPGTGGAPQAGPKQPGQAAGAGNAGNQADDDQAGDDDAQGAGANDQAPTQAGSGSSGDQSEDQADQGAAGSAPDDQTAQGAAPGQQQDQAGSGDAEDDKTGQGAAAGQQDDQAGQGSTGDTADDQTDQGQAAGAGTGQAGADETATDQDQGTGTAAGTQTGDEEATDDQAPTQPGKGVAAGEPEDQTDQGTAGNAPDDQAGQDQAAGAGAPANDDKPNDDKPGDDQTDSSGSASAGAQAGEQPADDTTGSPPPAVQPSDAASAGNPDDSSNAAGGHNSPHASSMTPQQRKDLAKKIVEDRAEKFADELEPEDPLLRQQRKEKRQKFKDDAAARQAVQDAQNAAQGDDEGDDDAPDADDAPPQAPQAGTPPKSKPQKATPKDVGDEDNTTPQEPLDDDDFEAPELPAEVQEMLDRASLDDLRRAAAQHLFSQYLPESARGAAERLRPTVPLEDLVGWEGPHRTGRRINPKASVRDEAKPEAERTGKILDRRTAPGDVSVGWVLIVDVSPSMKNPAEIVENVLRASASGSYLAEELKMKYAEIVFGKRGKVIKNMGDPLSSFELKDGLLTRVRDSFDDTSINQDTNIREPLGMAITMLEREEFKQKTIVLITDGGEGATDVLPEWIPPHLKGRSIRELNDYAREHGIDIIVIPLGSAKHDVGNHFDEDQYDMNTANDGSDIPEVMVELAIKMHEKRLNGGK